MKLNGNKPIIVDDDIIVTAPSNFGDSLQKVIDKHHKDIEKLKSNMKFIYSYGGVGGSGSGGSGGGSAKEPKLYAELKNIETGESKQINLDINNTNPLILPKPGAYRFYAKLSNSGGEKFFLKYATGANSIDLAQTITLSTELNNCETPDNSNTLTTNGTIKVRLQNSDGDILYNAEQRYIVEPHDFEISFMYLSPNGNAIKYDSGNEHLLGDETRDPFINIDYDIHLPQVDMTQFVLTYSIGDFVTDERIECTESTGNKRIFLKDILKDGQPFLRDENTGTYNVSVSLKYKSSVVTEQQSVSDEFEISLIPSSLFINITPSLNILYDSEDEIVAEMGEQTIPSRALNIGAYLTLYGKIYDGKVGSSYETYKIQCTTYDKIETEPDVYEWTYASYGEDNVIEQRIGSGISFNFNTTGIKKIVLRTESNKSGLSYEVAKYIYVKNFDNLIDWPVTQFDYYYKVNDTPKYSVNNQGDVTFPDDVLGDSIFEQKFSYSPVELSHTAWMNNVGADTDITTVISFGIQLSNINTEHSIVLDIYSYEDIIYRLYTDALFGPEGSDENKIFIPTEDYNSIEGTKYHLVQICRHKQRANQYIDYLYIDGKLESCKHNVEELPARISKIVLNNVNASYNLINLQYYPSANLNIDAVVYRYWLAYKQRYINNASGIEITEIEKQMLTIAEGNRFKFDGSNVILNKSTVETIAASVDIPTVMFDYTLGPEETYAGFMEQMLTGYTAGNTESFGNRDIHLWWCGGRAQTNTPMLVDLGEPEIGGLRGTWQFSFQGTSTMANRIKNFSLRLVTGGSSGGDEYDKILFSPKFKKGDSTTFLPEREWTLKADIADSAHANNTSVGKFVNTVCSKFDTKLTPSDANAYVKNTLEGFPVLMFFRCNSDDQIYYFGVYNFNLGRTSYNNLGYNTDISDVYAHATESTPSNFAYSYARGVFNSNLAVGEIQENMGCFDFSQTAGTLLFAGPDKDVVGNNPHMFGPDSKITGSVVSTAKGTLRTFVEQIAEAGTFCFNMIGKTFVNPQTTGEEFSNDVYKTRNCVTDPSYQIAYDNAGNIIWSRTDRYDVSNLTNDSLLKAISYYLSDDTPNSPTFDYKSGSEYYTICMAFGLVDSILKNMNIKSWNNRLCYCAFYDMDCAFGEDNSGNETVSYMAATDYWTSPKKNGVLQKVNIDYDYWDEVNGGKGFDFTSSYLLAVIKYAKPICNYIADLSNTQLDNYPQDFWAKLRGVNGELRNTDYFLNKYFKSGVHVIPEYLTSLNYKVKYLYTDDNGTPLANSVAFNGTRYAKVKDWLTKRLHFLDVMFNVQGLRESIRENIVIPSPTQENMNATAANPDVVILKDAFSDEEQDKSISSNTKIINIYAPKNTPVIVYAGGTAKTYILPENTNDRLNPNKLEINTTQAQRTKIYGSKEFIDVSDVGVFFTTYRKIESDKLENVIYENAVVAQQTGGFIIKSVSVREIKMNIPTYSGTLTLKDNSNPLIGSSITSIDISTSGFIGTFSGFPNLRSMNISSVKSENGNISILGNPLLTANNLIISGLNNRSLTTLGSLNIQDVAGNFNILNTAIKELTITGVLDENGNAVSEFSINGDLALRSLTLKNMKSISITNCPNLETLKIWGLEDLSTGTDGTCKSLVIDMSAYYNHKDYTPKLKTIISTGNDESQVVDGDFNLNTETFKNLEFLTIQALEGIVTLQLPDCAVKVGTMKNCKNLNVIKTEGTDSKLILTGPNTFADCPNYWMRNSSSQSTTYIDPHGYTKMGIDSECTDLSGTFALAQQYSNDKFSMHNAKYFIENIIIIRNSHGSIIDDSAAQRITTLARCFYNRKSIIYNSSAAYYDEEWENKAPILSNFISLKDISEMYYGIQINVITKKLLSLPEGDEYNTPSNPLKWDYFVKRGDIAVSTDCFKNISYRLTSLNDLTLTIMEPDDSTHKYVPISNTVDSKYNILELFAIREDSSAPYGYEPLTNIVRISTLNFDSSQFIDFSRFFEVLPNVTTIDNFMNTNVNNFNIEGLLKPCENLTSITSSFISASDNYPAVDLWNFFNWEGNKNIRQLFTSYVDNDPAFSFAKTVTYKNLVNILEAIEGYTNLDKLTNIFSNCTVTGYNALGKPEICFKEGTVLNNIKCINYLFTNMKSDRSDGGLSFSRNLFVQLPSVEKLRMTFSGVRFTEMLSMDFFAKRDSTPQTREVYLLTGNNSDSDDSYGKHILNTYGYTKNIVDLNNTFYNARFVSCNPWYERDMDNVGLNLDENYISTLGGERVSGVNEYYICDNRDFYTITYGDGLTTRINCTDNIMRKDVSVPYSSILGTIYAKKNSNRYEGYVKVGDDYNIVFTNIPGFATIFNRCTVVEDTDYRTFVIERYNRGSYTKYVLSTPEIDDCSNNFTHYIKDIDLVRTDETTIYKAWQNHNLMREYGLFYEGQGITETTELTEFVDSESPLYNKKFIVKYNSCGLYPTYCILPPDILYSCYSTVDLTGTFSDINAMGVIPRHFTSNCSDKNLSDLLRNTDVLPNVQYYFRDYAEPNIDLMNILSGIPAVEFDDYDILNPDGTPTGNRIEYETPSAGETYSDIAVVIYRDIDGNLRRRSKNNRDKEKGQFVYAPSGYSKSINIQNTFNFRYNLPPDNIIPGEYVNEQELIDRTNEPMGGESGLKNIFYTQYFIMMDDSAKWSIVSDARSPFITNNFDRDYVVENKVRQYYIDPAATFENAWTRVGDLKDAGGWYSYARQTFNVMLNLCGTTDEYTSCVNDNGCPINLDNSVKLDNFLEGNLVTFLNGRVFYKTLDVSSLTTSANKISAGSYIINMPTIAKNIILPSFNNNLYDDDLVFINSNKDRPAEYNFYGFMFNDETNEASGSIYNYIHSFSKTVGEVYISIRTGAIKYKHN